MPAFCHQISVLSTTARHSGNTPWQAWKLSLAAQAWAAQAMAVQRLTAMASQTLVGIYYAWTSSANAELRSRASYAGWELTFPLTHVPRSSAQDTTQQVC